jgi:hypothetical protein
MQNDVAKQARKRKEERFPVTVEAIAKTRAAKEVSPVVRQFLLSLGASPEQVA